MIKARRKLTLGSCVGAKFVRNDPLWVRGRDVHAALQHQRLYLAQAQIEPSVGPHDVSIDLPRKTVRLVADFLGSRPN